MRFIFVMAKELSFVKIVKGSKDSVLVSDVNVRDQHKKHVLIENLQCVHR